MKCNIVQYIQYIQYNIIEYNIIIYNIYKICTHNNVKYIQVAVVVVFQPTHWR